jgi:hypothetical protein
MIYLQKKKCGKVQINKELTESSQRDCERSCFASWLIND